MHEVIFDGAPSNPLKNFPASYLETSAESLSRYFRDFEAKGWIERHRRKIIIKPAFGEEFK
ncbi:helix-turn-helix domain-containing protein [Limosilactobacillus reuteri]|uniref:helix-turn-helix domain-containing protein n=1 Tax=Limosilactobacillus reuteri TaxID=1598 RepID=UPI0034607C43